MLQNLYKTNENQSDEELLEIVIEKVDENNPLYKKIVQYQMIDMYYKKILVEYKGIKISVN